MSTAHLKPIGYFNVPMFKIHTMKQKQNGRNDYNIIMCAYYVGSVDLKN